MINIAFEGSNRAFHATFDCFHVIRTPALIAILPAINRGFIAARYIAPRHLMIAERLSRQPSPTIILANRPFHGWRKRI